MPTLKACCTKKLHLQVVHVVWSLLPPLCEGGASLWCSLEHELPQRDVPVLYLEAVASGADGREAVQHARKVPFLGHPADFPPHLQQ